MNISIEQTNIEAIAVSVNFTNNMICLILSDGREIRTPLKFYPKLANAKPQDLNDFRLMAGGRGIHWEILDEDLSVDSIVRGRRAHNFTNQA